MSINIDLVPFSVYAELMAVTASNVKDSDDPIDYEDSDDPIDYDRLLQENKTS